MQCKSGFLLMEMLCALAIVCAGCGILASHASYIIQSLAQSNRVCQFVLHDNMRDNHEQGIERSDEEVSISLSGLPMPRCDIEQSSDTKFPLDLNNNTIAKINYVRATYSWKERSGAISTRQRIFAKEGRLHAV